MMLLLFIMKDSFISHREVSILVVRCCRRMLLLLLLLRLSRDAMRPKTATRRQTGQ
jgi:hypothetical protein